MVDWSRCDLLEIIPGKHSGDPLIIGTRIPADAILHNFQMGSSIEEIAEDYPRASRRIIEALLEYAAKQGEIKAA